MKQKRMTRKEKIAAGLPKGSKYAAKKGGFKVDGARADKAKFIAPRNGEESQ